MCCHPTIPLSKCRNSTHRQECLYYYKVDFFAPREDPAALAGGVGSPACCRQSCRHWFPAGPQAGWTAGRKPEAHPTRRRTRARDRSTELRLAALCHVAQTFKLAWSDRPPKAMKNMPRRIFCEQKANKGRVFRGCLCFGAAATYRAARLALASGLGRLRSA